MGWFSFDIPVHLGSFCVSWETVAWNGMSSCTVKYLLFIVYIRCINVYSLIYILLI